MGWLKFVFKLVFLGFAFLGVVFVASCGKGDDVSCESHGSRGAAVLCGKPGETNPDTVGESVDREIKQDLTSAMNRERREEKAPVTVKKEP